MMKNSAADDAANYEAGHDYDDYVDAVEDYSDAAESRQVLYELSHSGL